MKINILGVIASFVFYMKSACYSRRDTKCFHSTGPIYVQNSQDKSEEKAYI